MKVTVIGLGKIGLPLAVQFANKGISVMGLDNNETTVNLINSAEEPFPGEKNLSGFLKEVVTNKVLIATVDVEFAISNADVIVVCVPLVVTSKSEPDFTGIDEVVRDIGRYAKKGALISFETTLPVGTTRLRFAKILEKESKLKIGEELFVVFSPERVLTGRIFSDLRKYPKLVGGVSASCTSKGVGFYELALDFDQRFDLDRSNGVWAMKSSDAAEFAKIAETTYRDVNIGLANEFALFAKEKDIDILEVIEASNSQPFSHIHTPGISVGGHCIPIYPQFYIWENPISDIVKTARKTNSEMPIKVVTRLNSDFGSLDGLSIGILGVTYRPGVKESAFTGTKSLQTELVNLGAQVFVTDPFYSEEELREMGSEAITDNGVIDGLILHTAHDVYLKLSPTDFPKLRFIFDGRNFLKIWQGSKTYKYFSI